MICQNIFLTQDLSQVHEENLRYFGYMIIGNKPVNGVPVHIQNGCYWMLDNGAFSKDGFIKDYWLEWMDYMRPYQDTCICVVIPDVVGDCEKTLALFPEYAHYARERGYRVAHVTQNGMIKHMLPWDDFDCLFVGGSDDHKMGREAGYLIEQGLKLGKHIHVGRVNTEYRLMKFWHCHTWDGSSVSIKPDKYEEEVVNGVRRVIEKKEHMKSAVTLFDLA